MSCRTKWSMRGTESLLAAPRSNRMLIMQLPKEKIINTVGWIPGAGYFCAPGRPDFKEGQKNAGDKIKWKSLDHGSSQPQRPHHRHQGRCSQLACHEDVEPLVKKANSRSTNNRATTAYLPRDVERFTTTLARYAARGALDQHLK